MLDEVLLCAGVCWRDTPRWRVVARGGVRWRAVPWATASFQCGG